MIRIELGHLTVTQWFDVINWCGDNFGHDISWGNYWVELTEPQVTLLYLRWA